MSPTCAAIQAMTRKTTKLNKIRAAAFKLRGGLWTVLFLAVLTTAERASLPAIGAGLVLVVLGQGLRFWAAGSIARYRGEEVGAQRLVTWGPYALARNPLYIGNGLIGAGWGLMAGWKALLLFAAAFFVIYCLLIIPWEEAFLRQKFGGQFEEYAARTGRFSPGRFSSGAVKGPFDASILWKSERYSALVTVAGTALLAARILWK